MRADWPPAGSIDNNEAYTLLSTVDDADCADAALDLSKLMIFGLLVAQASQKAPELNISSISASASA